MKSLATRRYIIAAAALLVSILSAGQVHPSPASMIAAVLSAAAAVVVYISAARAEASDAAPVDDSHQAPHPFTP